MAKKFGSENYDLGRYMQRGLHEIANALTPDSNVVVHDHSGLYGGREDRGVAPTEPDRGVEVQAPELDHDEPELDR